MERIFESSSEAALLAGGAEPSWAELVGSNNWEGLINDPVNVSLRRLILRCGNFCEATYDAFNYEEKSPYGGSSKYGKIHFFEKVSLESGSDYQVECFIYATAEEKVAKRVLTRSQALYPWDKKANFMGYIASTTNEASRVLGRREIYVVWRGTAMKSEWHAELCHPWLASVDPLLESPENHGCSCWCTPCGPKVEAGFLQLYMSTDPPFAKYGAGVQVKKKIHELREKYRNEEVSIIVTGHSLGASLSVLTAFDLVENEVKDIPVSAIVFACPKVGNSAFRKIVNSKYQNLKILHIKNKHDWIPCVPFALLGYVDIGIQLVIDNDESSSLKRSNNMWDWHNLEAMLHVIAGWDVQITRSPALVNKRCDLLQDRQGIPGSWWVQQNRGMVRDQDEKWILAPPKEEDIPVPENFHD